MASSAESAFPTPSANINLENIQGDVLVGLNKNLESFVFFRITDPAQFKHYLSKFIPYITTSKHTMDQRTKITDLLESRKSGQLHTEPREPNQLRVCTPGINLAFAFKGLEKLGVTDDLKDNVFKVGQIKDAKNIGDPGYGEPFDPDWSPTFKQEIHGVFLVAGDSQDTLNTHLELVKRSFGNSIHIIDTVEGHVRPGKQRGYEHFGFKDGISQPFLKGISSPPPPKIHPIDPGVILLGAEGDEHRHERPAWAKDGSFLAFRQLQQLVPEFHTFTDKHALPDINHSHGSELLGTRMVGRWPNGVPADVAPFVDHPAHGNENNFDFKDDPLGFKCPLAAHIRKMNPRNLDPPKVDPHRIIRKGIPYGPEVTPEESDGQTKHERGLLFVCYQSALDSGFSFLMQNWANNKNFPPPPPLMPHFEPGFDPIIGIHKDDKRSADGMYPLRQHKDLVMPFNFVVPRGGEYFFTPSISALKEVFAN
jgi:Dyp-type peroxidase family